MAPRPMTVTGVREFCVVDMHTMLLRHELPHKYRLLSGILTKR